MYFFNIMFLFRHHLDLSVIGLAGFLNLEFTEYIYLAFNASSCRFIEENWLAKTVLFAPHPSFIIMFPLLFKEHIFIFMLIVSRADFSPICITVPWLWNECLGFWRTIHFYDSVHNLIVWWYESSAQTVYITSAWKPVVAFPCSDTYLLSIQAYVCFSSWLNKTNDYQKMICCKC